MDKTLVKIEVDVISRAYRVSVPYIELLGSYGNPRDHIFVYHSMRKRVTELANIFGVDGVDIPVDDDEEAYKFRFVVTTPRDKDKIIDKLNEHKDAIFREPDSPLDEFLEIQVVDLTTVAAQS